MILFVQTRQGGDRWSFSHACLEACCCLCITVLTALSSTAISRDYHSPSSGLFLSSSGRCAGAHQEEVLSRRTNDYQGSVEAYACNQIIIPLLRNDNISGIFPSNTKLVTATCSYSMIYTS